MDYSLVATVASLILVAAAALLGAKYQKLKEKAGKLRNLVDGLVKAWEDDSITEEEFKALVDQAKALLED